MKVYAALRKDDVGELYRARRNAEEELKDPERFKKRMQKNRAFAELYSGDPKVRQLQI